MNNGILSSVSIGDPFDQTSSGGLFPSIQSGTSFNVYVTPPIQVRAIANGVIVQVSYHYNGQAPGEYAFTDMAEATDFIKVCLEKMMPK